MNVKPHPFINSPQNSHYYTGNKLGAVKGLWPVAAINSYDIVGSLKARLGLCPKSITRLLSPVVCVMDNDWYLAEVVDRYELCGDCYRHSPVH
jgi:hypothetical protein